MKLTFRWNTLDQFMREQILGWACFNSNLIHYEWADFQQYEQQILQQIVSDHTNKTCELIGE